MKINFVLRMIATVAISAFAFIYIYHSVTQSFAEEIKQSDELKKLRLQRIEVLRKGSDRSSNMYMEGKLTFKDSARFHRYLAEAEPEAAESIKEKVAILRNSILTASKQEKSAQARFDAGATSELDVLEAQADRLRLEIELIQFLSQPPQGG